MSDKLSDERLRELLIGMSVCADFEESALMGEDAESLAAALDELLLLRRAIGVEPSRWVDSDGAYGEDTNLAAKYDGTLADAMAEARGGGA